MPSLAYAPPKTPELWETRGPQYTLGNIGIAGKTMVYGSSMPSGPARPTPPFPSALAPRAPLASRLHPIPYTRITICNGTSKHTKSFIHTSTTIVNKKVNYENLLQPGPEPPRWLAHNITSFPNSKHAITLTQTPKRPTASPPLTIIHCKPH